MPDSLTPADAESIDLCASTDLAEAGLAHVFDVVYRGEAMRAFALRHDGQVVAYLNRCAHIPAELDWNPGEFLDADRALIMCSVHGAVYEPSSGRCVAGPCGRGGLVPVRVQESQGRVAWYPSPDIRPLEFS